MGAPLDCRGQTLSEIMLPTACAGLMKINADDGERIQHFR
jgi:hypothetical protein